MYTWAYPLMRAHTHTHPSGTPTEVSATKLTVTQLPGQLVVAPLNPAAVTGRANTYTESVGMY